MENSLLLGGAVALVSLMIVAVLWLGPGRSKEKESARFELLLRNMERLERLLASEMRIQREEQAETMLAQRREIAENLSQFMAMQGQISETLSVQIASLGRLLGEGNESFALQMGEAQKNAYRQMENLRQKVEQELQSLRTENADKLEKMRETVDEKLKGALEQRLGESFQRVSERLEQVHRGLGEMQALAGNVGDLRKLLGNVKTRGVWGEIQLGALLAHMLSPEQYKTNVACREGSQERVEFVVRFPGRGEKDQEVWLPIDAKFPKEDFERLIEASENGDHASAEAASKALETRVRQFAKDVAGKYINPPRTTDFAILFVPTEGLYAELLRRPGFAAGLQRDFRVNLCGPSTLGALLNSLQLGFRTLMIEKRSSEVWALLGSVKTEFERYGETLDRLRQKIKEAGDQIDKVDARKRAIERQLRDVEGSTDEVRMITK